MKKSLPRSSLLSSAESIITTVMSGSMPAPIGFFRPKPSPTARIISVGLIDCRGIWEGRGVPIDCPWFVRVRGVIQGNYRGKAVHVRVSVSRGSGAGAAEASTTPTIGEAAAIVVSGTGAFDCQVAMGRMQSEGSRVGTINVMGGLGDESWDGGDMWALGNVEGSRFYVDAFKQDGINQLFVGYE